MLGPFNHSKKKYCTGKNYLLERNFYERNWERIGLDWEYRWEWNKNELLEESRSEMQRNFSKKLKRMWDWNGKGCNVKGIG